MKTPLTYGQLYKKLGDLSFRRQEIEMHGKPRYLFEHKTSENAMIFLPVRDPGEAVEPYFIRSVLAMLKGHNLVSDLEPLQVLTNSHKN